MRNKISSMFYDFIICFYDNLYLLCILKAVMLISIWWCISWPDPFYCFTISNIYCQRTTRKNFLVQQEDNRYIIYILYLVWICHLLVSGSFRWTCCSAFNEAITLALAHTLPSSFCQRHQSRWQSSNLSRMALAGRLTSSNHY